MNCLHPLCPENLNIFGEDTHVIVSGIYHLPSAHVDALNDISKILSQYASSEFIVMGDLNLDWLSGSSNSFKELCLKLNFRQTY